MRNRLDPVPAIKILRINPDPVPRPGSGPRRTQTLAYPFGSGSDSATRLRRERERWNQFCKKAIRDMHERHSRTYVVEVVSK
jgi:hypothetical protein